MVLENSRNHATYDHAILGRTLDKCRASLAGTVGEYHFNCPLDNLLFSFKGIDGGIFAAHVQEGATDEEISQWLGRAGTLKTHKEIEEWSNKVEVINPSGDPEKAEWFGQACQRLGLDPKSTTLFDYLEADDADCFK